MKAKNKTRRAKLPAQGQVLRLPDLDQAKSAVVTSLAVEGVAARLSPCH